MTPNDPAPPAAALSLEGRLLAHRRLLAELLRHLPEARRAGLADWLDQQALYQDGQEDPGAVPGEAVALELARADEFRALGALLKAASGGA